MIEILPYDPSWPVRFAAEASALRTAFGALALRIEHVGSTAVAGLAAKPVIDIQVSVPALAPRPPLCEPLAALGYVHVDLGDFDAVYPFFQKPASWPSAFHLHLCVAGSIEETRHLAFRDFLRAHPSACDAYVALKRELAARHGGHTPEAREAYSLAKSDFVASVLARALGSGARG